MIKSKYNILFIICHLRGVSETLCSLLVVLLFFPFSQVLKKIMLVKPVKPASRFRGWTFNETTGSLIKGRPLLKMKPFFLIIKNHTEPYGRYIIGTFVLSGKGYEYLELSKYRSEETSRLFSSRDISPTLVKTRADDSSPTQRETDDPEVYKSFYEWLAGVIDVVGVLKFKSSNKKPKSKNVILDLVLVRPYYNVLTAVWFKYGGSIKQISNVNKKKYKIDYKLNENQFWLKYARHPNYMGEESLDWALDNDFPFQVWRYRLKKFGKIENIIQNTYPLLRRKYIKNTLSVQKLIILPNSLILDEPTYTAYNSINMGVNRSPNSRPVFKNPKMSQEKKSNYNINWYSQWFAGVFDASGTIVADPGYLIIGLKDVCIELLTEIQRDFGEIGHLQWHSEYNKDGVVEKRVSWVISVPHHIIPFASFLLENYKFLSGKDHRLKLVEKYCLIREERNPNWTLGELKAWDIKMQKFLNEEWNKYTYL